MTRTTASSEDQEGQLIAAARAVSANAHAPYSQFHVGAALVTSDGRMFSGCNLESASFGLTQCAERNALGAAIAAGVRPGQVASMVIYLPGELPLPPCGACRQVMAELMAGDGEVLAVCDSDQRGSWRISELMPAPFLGEGLTHS